MGNESKKILVAFLFLLVLGLFFKWQCNKSMLNVENESSSDVPNTYLFSPFESEIDAAPLCCACVYLGSEMKTGTCYKELDNGKSVKVIGEEGKAYRIEYLHPNGEPTKGWTAKEWVR
jgi:hypothetical protein